MPSPNTQPTSGSTLQSYIQTAVSGDRTALLHLVIAIFTAARAAVRCLAEHYRTHHHLLTFETLARLKYCSERLEAIFHTLHHAPERFISPAQLRALTRARAILAHLWRQPVDFYPLTPILTAPETCPPPPRSVVAPASSRQSSPHIPDSNPSSPTGSPAPATASSSTAVPAADPLLLRNPGRALASVLLQLAAIYGVSAKPVTVPRPASPAASPSSASAPPPSSPADARVGISIDASGVPSPQDVPPDAPSPLHPPP